MTRRTRTGSAEEGIDRAAQAVLEADGRLPPEHLGRGGDIGERVADVAGARWLVAAFDGLVEQAADRVDQVVDALRGAGGDVEDAPVGARRLRCREIRLDDVLDVREVARLAAVAED